MFDRERSDFDGSVPANLDAMEPGPVLGAFLSAIDPSTLVGYDRVTVMRAHQRMASHHQAQVLNAMDAVADAYGYDDPNVSLEAASAEIAAALRLTRRSAESQVALAHDLHNRVPAVFERLIAGAIDIPRARVLIEGTWHLGESEARAVVDRIIDDAPRYTTGQLRSRLRRLCIETDPDDAKARYGAAVAERRVVMEPTPSGTAHLHAMNLPPERVAAITDRINRLAKDLCGDAETRTMDQLRSDVLLDILEGTAAPSPGGTVEITVDLATLIRLDEHPGDLAGYGPVVADIARQIALRHVDGEWTYTITDPDSALPVACGLARRRPSVAQHRAVVSRNRRCVFPGCRMPAKQCDVDHTIRFADGGPTTTCNLAPLCKHHHTTRHRFNWTYRRLPNADHLWTSPLRHTHTTTGLPPPASRNGPVP